MKALVTGGAGFIGSHLVERLVAEGHHVDVLDDLSSGSLANLASAREGRTKRLTIHQVDLRDSGVVDLIARRGPEVVFHLAAHDDGAGAREHAVRDAEVNVVGSVNLLEGARAAGTRKIVFASSAASVYEPAGSADLPIREGHPQVPLSPHGVAKKVVVDYLAAYRETHAIEFTALLLAEVYGPRRRSGLVADWLAQIQAGEPCTIDHSGLDTLDLVFVDDVVDAFVRAADKGSGLVVNIGTGVETSVADLFERLAALTGTKGELQRQKPKRGVEPSRFALDHGRARIHLGWKPWTSLDDGLRQVIDQSRS